MTGRRADEHGMANGEDYFVEIDGVREAAAADHDPPAAQSPRKWIGVTFDCCSAYTRIYRNRQGTAYQGHCPRCSRSLRVRIGPGGTGAHSGRA